MASFDSILNVDEWISDYYLTNDESKGESFGKRAAAAVKLWKAEDKETGAGNSPWSRLTSQRNALQTALSTIDGSESSVAAAAEAVQDSFGYPPVEEVTLRRSDEQLTVRGAMAHNACVLLATPISSIEDFTESKPWYPVMRDAKPQDISIGKLVTEVFLSEEAPEFIVVIAGNWVILAERDAWPLGRYLGVDVALAVERNDTKAKGELETVVAALAWEHIARAADGTTWWEGTITESREHAVKVSEDLRQAIKESIEIIGNDVLSRYRAQGRRTAEVDGNELAKQSLRYLYRILFLLFAESSPELNILPSGVPEYEEGYGLAHLRDRILVEPPTERAAQGTYLYDSLAVLFGLVNEGHNPEDPQAFLFDANAGNSGLAFRNLAADLFTAGATAYINASKLSNSALHRVLQNLLLTREVKGKERGFVSYATLGVTQLGQVYEGLMSYTGFVAQQELVEVAPHGDPSKGSWVVSPQLAETLPTDSIVQEQFHDSLSGTMSRTRRHPAGSFVYRQSSRDRERSASFYSPPVITEFTVGQALEVLQESGRISCADDILTLTICEPAMGSGAFAVEAVNQLAELYIQLKQEELDQSIDADQLTTELQRVKAHIALHQVYGVDLNKTAVELAEISLWLDTMTAELKAPWFGLHLRHGNSLIGATRSTFTANDVKKKAYLTEVPKHHSVETMTLDSSRIHHFLVPSNGWGAAADAKDLKELAATEIKTMKTWRSAVRTGFTAGQVKTLKALSERVELLWELSLLRQRIAETQIRRDIHLWGQAAPNSQQVVERAEVEKELFENRDGSYQRLRLVMNAWNALWFWPVSEVDQLPDHAEWISMLQDALGAPNQSLKDGTFGSDLDWKELDYIESLDFGASGQLKHDELLAAHPWLNVVEQVSAEQAFFHWDLDFAAVMSRGGFDFQVGNPPWVRPRTDADALLSEHDPWFSLAHKPTQAAKNSRRQELVQNPAVFNTLARGLSESVVTSAVLGDNTRYPHLVNQQPDLYRAFMEKTWSIAHSNGVISLIHPESHFTEKKAAPLRAGAYCRLRRHWQFVNALMLFDIDDHVVYGIHIYGNSQYQVNFKMASKMYHPRTAAESLSHDGTGDLPGIKDPNYNWDLRPHKDRIITVNEDTLKLWNSILEDPETPLLSTRTVYTVNTEAAGVLEKLAAAPRIKELGLQFSAGWHESADRKKGYFDSSWQHPESWKDVILQGPHLGVSTPMIKQPNPTMKHNQDWSEIDLEAIPADFIPATAYAPNREIDTYDADYGTWNSAHGRVPVADHFRIAWRRMAATTGFRTFYPAIVPPGARHVNAVISGGPIDNQRSIIGIGFSSSFLNDFLLRSTGVSDIWQNTFESLALGSQQVFTKQVGINFLRLNCLSSAFAPLWEEVAGEKWTVKTPLRNAKERWHAQNEIDAIVALSLGITADELCMIYRTQFPVMRRYDREDLFDANGRKVAKDVIKLQDKLKSGEELSEAERTWTHPQSGVTYLFEYPFAPLDREADLRAAYARFEGEL